MNRTYIKYFLSGGMIWGRPQDLETKGPSLQNFNSQGLSHSHTVTQSHYIAEEDSLPHI